MGSIQFPTVIQDMWEVIAETESQPKESAACAGDIMV